MVIKKRNRWHRQQFRLNSYSQFDAAEAILRQLYTDGDRKRGGSVNSYNMLFIALYNLKVPKL